MTAPVHAKGVLTDEPFALFERRTRAAKALAACAAAMAACASEPRPTRDPYVTSGVPDSSGKANSKKRAERKRQRKARRKNR